MVQKNFLQMDLKIIKFLYLSVNTLLILVAMIKFIHENPK